MSEELDPQPLPHSKEQPQALLHSAAERDWELLQEKGKKKEKKLDFKSEIVLITGRLSPTCSRAWGALAPQLPSHRSPLMPGMEVKELLTARSSLRGGQGPAPGDRGASPSGLSGERSGGQVRRLSTYPSQEEGDREDHCRTERRTTRDNREGKNTK